MKYESVNTVLQIIFWFLIVVYPIAVIALGRRYDAMKLGTVSGVFGIIYFFMAYMGFYFVDYLWLVSEMESNNTSDERASELFLIINNKGRDFAIAFGYPLSLIYGVLVMLFLICFKSIVLSIFDFVFRTIKKDIDI